MDIEAFNELKDIMGDIIHELINTFLTTMPEQIDSLQLALEQGDSEQVFEIAHRIKSSSSSIAAADLAESAAAIEMKGRAGDVSGLDEPYRSLVGKYEEAAEFLRAQLD